MSVVSRTRIICGECKREFDIRNHPGGPSCDCKGATYMGVADARCRDASDAFAEIEAMDMLVSVVEMDSEDLIRFQRKYSKTTDYDGEGIGLWGARVKLIDGKLIVWDEQKGRKFLK